MPAGGAGSSARAAGERERSRFVQRPSSCRAIGRAGLQRPPRQPPASGPVGGRGTFPPLGGPASRSVTPSHSQTETCSQRKHSRAVSRIAATTPVDRTPAAGRRIPTRGGRNTSGCGAASPPAVRRAPRQPLQALQRQQRDGPLQHVRGGVAGGGRAAPSASAPSAGRGRCGTPAPATPARPAGRTADRPPAPASRPPIHSARRRTIRSSVASVPAGEHRQGGEHAGGEDRQPRAHPRRRHRQQQQRRGARRPLQRRPRDRERRPQREHRPHRHVRPRRPPPTGRSSAAPFDSAPFDFVTIRGERVGVRPRLGPAFAGGGRNGQRGRLGDDVRVRSAGAGAGAGPSG